MSGAHESEQSFFGSPTPSPTASWCPSPKIVEPIIGYRLLLDVEVVLNSEAGCRGIVTEAEVDGSMVRISMLEDKYCRSEVCTKWDGVIPVQPSVEDVGKRRLVKVLDGPHKRTLGWLQSIKDKDGTGAVACVELSTRVVIECPLDFVAIAHAPRTIRSSPPPTRHLWPRDR